MSTIISDHRFRASDDVPWGRCVVPVASLGDWLVADSPTMEPCGLAESAHASAVGRLALAKRYRCPWCVSTGVEVCEHEDLPLGMDGAPLDWVEEYEPLPETPDPFERTMPLPDIPEYRPVAAGACTRCGGLMVRTGACETCVDCGETTGCG